MADPSSGLTWAVRRSFLRYLSSMPDGRGILYGGATASPAGILFPAGEARIDPETGAGTVSFTGGVHFVGHFGMLSVRIGEPRLEITDEAGMLTIADGDGRLTLATFTAAYERADGRAHWRSGEVRLTEAGSEVFGGSYPPGDDLDPFTAEAPLSADAAQDAG